MAPLPDGAFKRIAFDGAAGSGAILVDATDAGAIGVAHFEPRFWIARDAVIAEARGRGSTWIVRSGTHALVLRHYRRGGLVARVSRDRYLWRGEDATRPFRELRLLGRMYLAGLPVPPPVAALYRRHGATWRGDLLIGFVPGTETLAQRLSSGNVSLATWAAIGRVIRRFHRHGVFHRDLNAHNILLHDVADVSLIDFDGATLRKPGLWCDGNLVRLRRSLEKINDGAAAGRFDDMQWHCLLGAYQEP